VEHGTAAGGRRVRVAITAAVFAWSFLAFWPALAAGFVDWDDAPGLLHNPDFRGLDGDALGWMFTTFHGGHYQPLTWLTFAVDHAVWGMTPRGYHLQNLLWHAVAAALLFAVARRVFLLAGLTTGACLGAGLAALLFGVHPLRVESVVWVTERRDVLSAATLLAAVLVYLRRDGRPSGWLVLWFALSLMSKAWGMTLPLVLLLLDHYPLRRTAEPGAWGRLIREKLPLFALALAAAWLASRAQLSTGASPGLDVHGVAQRAAQAAYGLCFYPLASIWPSGLSPVYPLRWGFDPWQPVYIWSAAAALTALVLAYRARRCCPAITASVFVYAVVVSPVLGVLQTGPQLVADRYSYLSCMSLALLAAGAWARWFEVSPRPRRLALSAAALAALVFATSLTVRQSMVWHDSVTLWQRAVAVDPGDPEAHYRLGRALLERRDDDPAALAEAHAVLQRASTLFDQLDSWQSEFEDDAAVALAWCVLFVEERSGQPRRVLVRRQFEQVAARWPDSGPAHAGLGIAFGVEGRLAEAVTALRRAVQLDPTLAEAHFNLGRLYAANGHTELARQHLQEALRLQPGNAAARELLSQL